MLAAFAALVPSLGADVRDLLQSPQRPSADVVLTMLINELFVALRDAEPDARFILVLDDYHLIDTPAIHEAVVFLLEHLPPQMRLVIATRTDPPFPLPRLRARRQLVEIRAADLRFTNEETACFLNDVMGLNLTPADIAALETRTEGWIASLQLAALALQGASSPGAPATRSRTSSLPSAAAIATSSTTWPRKSWRSSLTKSALFAPNVHPRTADRTAL